MFCQWNTVEAASDFRERNALFRVVRRSEMDICRGTVSITSSVPGLHPIPPPTTNLPAVLSLHPPKHTTTETERKRSTSVLCSYFAWWDKTDSWTQADGFWGASTAKSKAPFTPNPCKLLDAHDLNQTFPAQALSMYTSRCSRPAR